MPASSTRAARQAIHQDKTVALRKPADLSVGGWRTLYIERASVAERADGFDRSAAADHAYKLCVAEWLFRHPEFSPPGSPCPVCRDTDRPGKPLVILGTGGGKVWLHRECRATWVDTRTIKAIAALADARVWAQPKTLEDLVPGLVRLTGELVHLPPADSSTGCQSRLSRW